MAKILIATLGTGQLKDDDTSIREYREAVYRFLDSGKTYKTSFIAAALSDHLQVDKLYLIGTSKSMWEEVYRYFSTASEQSVDDDYWVELHERIKDLNPRDEKLTDKELSRVNEAIDDYLKHIQPEATGGSRCFIIDYGLDEREIWNNFDVMMQIGETLTEDDEIYLDITHAFRSIPLFLYIMLDLIRILKLKRDFKIGGLYYGMLDVIREMGYAPIVDLSPLYNMTLWTRGAYNFLNFGNGYLLADLVSNQELSDRIMNISDIVNINFIDEFKREIDRLAGLLNDANSKDPLIKYMEPYLMTFVDRFKGINSSSQLQLTLAKWYFEHKRFAQCYICLAEAIVSRILEEYRARDSKIKWNNANRNKIKYLIYKTNFDTMEKFKDLCDLYREISTTRNLIAHAGFADEKELYKDKAHKNFTSNRQKSVATKIDYKDAINKINSHMRNTENHVFNNKHLKEIPDLFPFNKLSGN